MSSSNNGITPIGRFWRMLKPDSVEIRNVYVYALFIGLINLSLPVGIQAIINLIQGGTYSTSWLMLVLFVCLGIAVGGVMQIGQLKITEALQQKIFTRAAFEFVYRIPRIQLEQIREKYAPELMNRFFDVMSVQKGLAKLLIDFSLAIFQVAFGLILLSLYSSFFIFYSVLLVFLLYLIFKFTANKGMKSSLEESKKKYEVAHWLQEVARSTMTFKLMKGTNLPLERMNAKVAGYITTREEHFSILKMQYGYMVAFKVFVALGLLVMGSVLVMEQQMNIGQFVASEIIILMILNSVEKIIVSFESIYDTLTGLEKIGQVTDLILDKDSGSVIECGEEGLKIQMRNVTCKHDEDKEPILANYNLDIEAKSAVCLKNTNSLYTGTILQLLAGHYKVKSGSILFNDHPITTVQITGLKSLVNGCFLKERLFEGTILENITVGRNIPYERVKEIVEKLNFKKVINKFPDGMESYIYPHDLPFSSTIEFKILLARTIIANPKLVLIDEGINLLPIQVKEDVLEFLTDKSNDWTLIVSEPFGVELNNYFNQVIE